MHTGWFQSECLSDLRVREMLVEAQVQDLLHVEGFDLLIEPRALLLFFQDPLLLRRELALELAVECMHVVQQRLSLIVKQLLLFAGDHLLNTNGLI